jgi:DASH complex subunit Spc34
MGGLPAVTTTPLNDCLAMLSIRRQEAVDKVERHSRRNLAKYSRVSKSKLFRVPEKSILERVAVNTFTHTMTTSLQPHLDSISSNSASISSLPFNTIPTHFISSLLHQSGVDNLLRDPHPHERGLFTVKPPHQKENIHPLNGGTETKVLRTRPEKQVVSPLLLAKYSAGGNVEADVFLRSADQLLQV